MKIAVLIDEELCCLSEVREACNKCSLVVAIGSNIASLRAARQLDRLSGAGDRLLQNLSSGLRINRAADDPAGLSVSLGLNSKSRILNRAVLNLSDGSSLINIADAALGEIGNILTRLGELAQQAANGSFSSAQRKTLGEEYVALDKEIRRIGASTTFNGLDLLSGTASNRAGKFLYNDGAFSSGQILGSSSDGRFVFSYSDSGNTLIDTVTGDVRVGFAGYGNSGFSTAQVLDNGDVMQYVNGTLTYYTYSTSTSRTVFTGANDGAFWEGAARISKDGRYITFVSTSNFTNADGAISASVDGGGARVWQIDLETNTIRKAADVSGVSSNQDSNGALSSDGRYYAFTTISGQIKVVDTFGGNGNVNTYSASGLSYYTGLIGVTTSGEALFTDGTNLKRTSGTSSTIQLSNFSQTASLLNVSMSADGTIINFASARNLLGNNAGLKYQVDLTTGIITKRTNSSSNSTGPGLLSGLSADGSRGFRWDTTAGDLYVFDTTSDNSSFDFEAGSGISGRILGSISSFNATLRGLGSGVLSSKFGARIALDMVQSNLSNLAQLRGVLGAVQSRLTTGTNLAKVQADETIAANSRVKDADIASDAGELVRISILKQAGAALLAQANQQPQIALLLLR